MPGLGWGPSGYKEVHRDVGTVVVVVTGLDARAVRVHILLLWSVGLCPYFLRTHSPDWNFQVELAHT